MEIIVTVVYYLLASALLIWLLMASVEASERSAELYALRSPAAQLDSKLKALLSDLTFGLYEEGQVVADAFTELVATVNAQQQQLLRLSWLLAGISLLYIIIVTLLSRTAQRMRWHRLAFHVLGASLVLLIAGLLAPMFALVIYQQLPLLGEVVFRHDTKGILSTIWTLLTSSNWFVAVLLVIFSVLVPVLKLILSAAALIRPRRSRRLFYAIQAIGKWSMTDVFVVAVLLAVFALSSDGLTDARLHVGLYFFAAYSLLSIVSTQLMAQSPLFKPRR